MKNTKSSVFGNLFMDSAVFFYIQGYILLIARMRQFYYYF